MPVPGRPDAAQYYLRWAETVRNPDRTYDGAGAESRDLTKPEQAVYDAALAVLLRYFTGEQDYGDVPPPAEASKPEVRELAIP